MKRIQQYTDVELAKLGGKVGPSLPHERISANRKPVPARTPILAPRANHLPQRRPLFAAQREPEA